MHKLSLTKYTAQNGHELLSSNFPSSLVDYNVFITVLVKIRTVHDIIQVAKGTEKHL